MNVSLEYDMLFICDVVQVFQFLWHFIVTRCLMQSYICVYIYMVLLLLACACFIFSIRGL